MTTVAGRAALINKKVGASLTHLGRFADEEPDHGLGDVELPLEKHEHSTETSRGEHGSRRSTHRVSLPVTTVVPRPTDLPQWSLMMYDIAYGKHESAFSGIMIVFIVIAGVLVGLQTYPSLADSEVLDVIDKVVLAAFTAEIVIKLGAEGRKPWRFFINADFAWNWFDFMIVLLSMPFITFGSRGLYLLRLVRLTRLVKLLKKVPQLRMILMGLMEGLKSIVYILVLLILVFYLYAVAGIYAFGFNDPFHFHNIASAMLTLFQVSTFDSWSDVLYCNVYGCKEYDMSGLYITDPAENVTSPLFRCDRSTPSYVVGPLYWISFVITSIIIVALFVGTVTMSMYDSMEETKREMLQAEKQRRMEQEAKKVQLLQTGRKSFLDKKAFEKTQRMKRHVMVVLGRVRHDSDVEDKKAEPTFLQMYRQVSSMAGAAIESSQFGSFIILVIVLAGINVGLGTYKSLNNDPLTSRALNGLDVAILVVFIIEIVLKVVSEDRKPWRYFYNGWNIFDFLIVLGSLIPNTGVSGLVPMLRLLRLFRVLKLLKTIPQLRIIVQALLNGFKSIGFIGIILFLFFYVFGILGVMLFSANDKYNFGSLHIAMQTLVGIVTLSGWSDIMYKNIYGCNVYVAGTEATFSTCDTPVALGYIASLYFIVFIVIGSWVLLTLFVGVVTTSMEEAKEQHLIESHVNRKVLEFQAAKGLSDGQIQSFREAFDMLDFDKDGVVDKDELSLGLSSVGVNFASEQQLDEYIAKVDEDGSCKLDLWNFVHFMWLVRADQDKLFTGTVVLDDSTFRESQVEDAIAVTVVNPMPPAAPTSSLRPRNPEASGLGGAGITEASGEGGA